MNLPRPEYENESTAIFLERIRRGIRQKLRRGHAWGISSVDDAASDGDSESGTEWKRHVLLPASAVPVGSSARATHVPAGNAACE